MAKIHMAPEKRKDVFQLLLHVVDTFVEQLRLSQYRWTYNSIRRSQ